MAAGSPVWIIGFGQADCAVGFFGIPVAEAEIGNKFSRDFRLD